MKRLRNVEGIFLFFILCISSLSGTVNAVQVHSTHRTLSSLSFSELTPDQRDGERDERGTETDTDTGRTWVRSLRGRTGGVDILGQPLLHGEPNFKHVVIRDGEDVPDLELQVNRDAFDDYVTNLLQGRVHAMQHAQWEWLDNLVRDTKRVVGAGIQKVAEVGSKVVNGVVEGTKAAAEGLANGVKAVADAISNGYKSIVNLLQLQEAFARLRRFVDNIGAILQSFGDVKFWDLLGPIVIGFVSGFTLGSGEEFITKLFNPPNPKPKGPAYQMIDDMKKCFRAAGEEVGKLFVGLFGDEAKRGGKGRLDFLKDQIYVIITRVGELLGSVLRLLFSEAFLKPLLSFFYMLVMTAVFTLVLLAIPGLGWFVKLAAMIITTVLAVVRFFLVLLPRFLSLIKSCWDKSRCTPKETADLVKTAIEAVGMAAAVLLAGKPDKATDFGGFSKAFSQNPIAKAMNLQVNPNVANTVNNFKTALAASGGSAKGVLQAFKATGAAPAIMGSLAITKSGKQAGEIFKATVEVIKG